MSDSTHRRRRRTQERGATLFVVVLAITMLTGVGLYTVHSAALAERAAGNGRQSSQADRIAELNTLTLLSLLRTEPRPYLQEAINATPGICEMNAGLPPGASCLQMTSDSFAPPTGAALVGADSLGALGTMSGKARLEITDVNDLQLPMPGYNMNDRKLRFYQATVTTIASLDPSGVSANACVNGMMQATGQRIVRAHLIVGPVPELGGR